jgi:acyl-CoA synthetase (AMP-forming)/AMP-acid ligase II
VVSIQMPNCYEAVVIAVAVLTVEGVVNPLLTSYRTNEVAHVYATARPLVHFSPIAVGATDFTELGRQARSNSGHEPLHVSIDLDGDTPPVESWFDEAGATKGTGESHRRAHADHQGAPAGQRVSELIFTSGTEATPKAVMHTENTANFSVRAAYAWLGLQRTDAVWMPSPVGHSTGFNYGLRFALYHGLKLVLQDRWDPLLALELLEREQCSYTLAATTFLQDLVDAATDGDVRLPYFRHFGCGGSPVPAALVDAAHDRGISVLRLYGATEFLVATWNTTDSTNRQRRQTDGAALPDVGVVVRDEEGNLCAQGQAGEVLVRGPNTCVGFFADAERTAATIDAEGWCRSGDLGVVDADGHLTLVGRKKDMIIRGGINIAPREIEDAIIDIPQVWQAAVIGMPDRRLGERCCACVVTRPGQTVSLETICDHLEARGFAKFKLPEELKLFDRFPTTASGKVQKHELKRQIEVTHG